MIELGNQYQVMDGLQAQAHHGHFNLGRARAEAEKGRVHQFQHSTQQALIFTNQCRYCGNIGFRLVQLQRDALIDSGQYRQAVELPQLSSARGAQWQLMQNPGTDQKILNRITLQRFAQYEM